MCEARRSKAIQPQWVSNSAKTEREPAKRSREERKNAGADVQFSPQGGNGTQRAYSDDGAAPVSTGAVRQDKRAEVPDLLKPGNFFKIN